MSSPEADLLKVAPDAPLADLKKAFRRAALAHHPDQNPHPEAARHFRRITEAYRILEARALQREPARPAPERPLADRIDFVLGDIAALVRRWPTDRWGRPVDGLPAGVWVASILEVLDRAWPGAGPGAPVAPDAGALAEAVEAWRQKRGDRPPLPDRGKAATADLKKAIESAEVRLRSLERPKRGGA